MPYVLGIDGCWRWRAVVHPLAHFRMITGVTGCAAVGLPAAIIAARSIPDALPAMTADVPLDAAPFGYALPSDAPYGGASYAAVPSAIPVYPAHVDVPEPGALAVLPAALVVAVLRRRRA